MFMYVECYMFPTVNRCVRICAARQNDWLAVVRVGQCLSLR